MAKPELALSLITIKVNTHIYSWTCTELNYDLGEYTYIAQLDDNPSIRVKPSCSKLANEFYKLKYMMNLRMKENINVLRIHQKCHPFSFLFY